MVMESQLEILQRGKHHSKPSMSEDSQLSSATHMGPTRSHAAGADRQHEDEEDEVTSPQHMGSHTGTNGAHQGQPMQLGSHAAPFPQPMQLDSPYQQADAHTQMDTDSHSEAGHSPSSSSHGGLLSQGVPAPKCSWQKASAVGAHARQHHAAGVDMSDAALLDRLDANHHASVSSRPAAQASDAPMYGMASNPAGMQTWCKAR